MSDNLDITYSASEEERCREIRDLYLGHAETKLEKLEAIERSVKRKAAGPAITLGIIATLAAGAGTSLCLVAMNYMAGVPLGLAGFAGVFLSWPLYKALLKRGRKAKADEVRRLTEDLEER